MVLTGAATKTWALGVVTVTLATTASLLLQPPGTRRLSVVGSLRFLGFFLVRSVKGGLQVALMAFRPRPALQPGLLDITLRLPDEAERIILAGTLSLLPGTLSVEMDGNVLQLHVLDASMPIEPEVRRAESMVARMFGVELP